MWPGAAQVRDYLLACESHLSEAHRQASRLTSKEVELGEAVLEFGQVCVQVSKTGVDGPLRTGVDLDVLCKRSRVRSHTCVSLMWLMERWSVCCHDCGRVIHWCHVVRGMKGVGNTGAHH